MIVLYSGKPRQGKTHEMVRDAYKRMKKNAGIWTWVNRPLGQTLKWGDLMNRVMVFDTLEELNGLIEWMDEREIKEVIIMIDEAQGYINARKWDLLSEEIQYLLQTHGHYGLDFYLTSQHESRIDIVCRQLVQVLYRFKCWHFFGFVLFIGIEYDTDTMDKEVKKINGYRFYLRSPGDRILYDTHAKIDFPKRPGVVVHKFIRCDSCGVEKRIG